MPRNWTAEDVREIPGRPGVYARQATSPRPTATTDLPEDTPEGTLLEKIRGIAKGAGWLAYHTYDSRRSEPGFVDLALCDGEALLLYELKTNRGKLTPEQAQWLSMLSRCTRIESGVWRPVDWAAITARLTRHP